MNIFVNVFDLVGILIFGFMLLVLLVMGVWIKFRNYLITRKRKKEGGSLK